MGWLGIDNHLAILDRRLRTSPVVEAQEDSAPRPQGELRIMARADKSTLRLIPGHIAAQVCAALVKRQETAICQPREIKTAIGDVRHRASRKIIHRSGGDLSAKLALSQARLHVGQADPTQFERCQTAEGHPGDF